MYTASTVKMDYPKEFTDTVAEPRTSYLKKTIKAIAYLLLYVLLVLLIMDIVLVPLIVYNSTTIRQKVVFMNYLNYHTLSNYSDPHSLGLMNAYNTRLKTNDSSELGVWYIPAKGSEVMFNGSRVVIYCHGTAESRGAAYNIERYNKLTSMGFDVVAFDYRQYGDSLGEQPTAEGVVNDTFAVYEQVRKEVPPNKIVLWGHAMGGAVVTNLMERIDEDVSMVLESPFDKIGNVLHYSPVAIPFRVLPCFGSVYVDAVNNDPNTNLRSIAAVAHIRVSVPILILAARYDNTVPYVLSESLYEAFREYRLARMAADTLKYALFEDETDNLRMYKAHQFRTIVNQFMRENFSELNEN